MSRIVTRLPLVSTPKRPQLGERPGQRLGLHAEAGRDQPLVVGKMHDRALGTAARELEQELPIRSVDERTVSCSTCPTRSAEMDRHRRHHPEAELVVAPGARGGKVPPE